MGLTTPISTKPSSVEIWRHGGLSLTLERSGGVQWAHLALKKAAGGVLHKSSIKALSLAIKTVRRHYAPVYVGVVDGRRSIDRLARLCGGRSIGFGRDRKGRRMRLYVWSVKDA